MGNFTPVASLIGGILIGLSAAAMLLFNGKIAGISGIVGGLLSPTKNEVLWRVAFVGGLITGGLMLKTLSPHVFEISVVRSGGAFVLAGLLIGFGSRLDNGCTAGHGVCGVSRGSVRSIVATVTFIVTGAAVVYVVNHLFGGAL